ncbi:MAG: hypothetical protein Q9177_006747, partial [Variospora cf. flavescens]
MAAQQANPTVSISPLLSKLLRQSTGDIKSHDWATADEIAAAITLIFTNELDSDHRASLLTILHALKRDRETLVLAKCGQAMRKAAAQ